MLAARGLGAVLGGLFIAALASGGFRGKIWTASSFAMPVVITLFALSRKLPITLLLLVMLGFAMITILNNSNAMVQSRVPDELRGRVMSLYHCCL
jgi:predicted MFS family arabinose efflux permease